MINRLIQSEDHSDGGPIFRAATDVLPFGTMSPPGWNPPNERTATATISEADGLAQLDHTRAAIALLAPLWAANPGNPKFRNDRAGDCHTVMAAVAAVIYWRD